MDLNELESKANAILELQDREEYVRRKCWSAKICAVCGEPIRKTDVLREKQLIFIRVVGDIWSCKNGHQRKDYWPVCDW